MNQESELGTAILIARVQYLVMRARGKSKESARGAATAAAMESAELISPGKNVSDEAVDSTKDALSDQLNEMYDMIDHESDS